MTTKSGLSFVGTCIGDEPNVGKMMNWDGTTYEGTFVNGLLEGEGIKKHSNLDVYRGEFKGGKQHGQGTLRRPNGDEYVGQW